MAENKKIRVLIKKPKEEAYIAEIDDELETLNEIVGGIITCTTLPGRDDIDIYSNDEALNLNLEGNIWLASSIANCICGTCFFVGHNCRTGESVSLTDEQIEKCKEYIKTFQIKPSLDLYLDFDYIEPIMMRRSKQYLNINDVEM